MAERVERFDPQIAGATEEGFLPMDQMVDGSWVRFEDYERVEKERDELLAEGREAVRRLLRSSWPDQAAYDADVAFGKAFLKKEPDTDTGSEKP